MKKSLLVALTTLPLFANAGLMDSLTDSVTSSVKDAASTAVSGAMDSASNEAIKKALDIMAALRKAAPTSRQSKRSWALLPPPRLNPVWKCGPMIWMP